MPGGGQGSTEGMGNILGKYAGTKLRWCWLTVQSQTRTERILMDHSSHVRLRAEELNPCNLEGAKVYGPDDSHVGDVAHIHGSGPQAQAVVDVGGFLGIGAKPVGLSLASLDFMRDQNGTVHATTAMTKDQLKNLPEHHH